MPSPPTEPLPQPKPARDAIHILRLRSIRGWMWFTFVLFTTMAAFSWLEEMYWVASFHSLFAIIGALAVVSLWSYRINSEMVWTATPVGRYGIRWDEVQAVDFDGFGIVFHGDRKRFVMIGPGMWSEKERQSFLPLLNEILSRRRIPCSSHRAGFTFTKNAKIR